MHARLMPFKPSIGSMHEDYHTSYSCCEGVKLQAGKRAHHFLALRHPIRQPYRLEHVSDQIGARFKVVRLPVSPHHVYTALIVIPTWESANGMSCS